MEGYKKLRLLGGGGYGEVFQCEHEGTLVAVKTQYELPDDDAERFRKEVRILSKLDHPNIITVLDCQLKRKPYWFVMPCFDMSLKDVLSDYPQNEDAIAHVFGCVLDGVRHAHEANVIHRDLKPGNILLNHGGEVVVADFGLGRQTSTDSARLTRTSASPAGTIEYMAPEVRSKFKNADERSDIFSLGIILYEMYTGEESFLGAHDLTRLPAGIMRIVRACIEGNPEKRYPSVADLKEGFATVTKRQADVASQSKLRSMIERIRRKERRSSDSLVAIRHILAGPDTLDEYREIVLELPTNAFADALNSNPEQGWLVLTRFVESTAADTSYEFRYVDTILRQTAQLHNSLAYEAMKAEIVKCHITVTLSWTNFVGRGFLPPMLSKTRGKDEIGQLMQYLIALPTYQLKWLAEDNRFSKLTSPFGPFFAVNA